MSPGADNPAVEPERETLASYALGALDPGEAANLELHVESCERCREYLRWLRPAIELLPASVDQLRPSPKVREAILAEVHADAAAAGPVRRPRRSRSFAWQGLLLRPATGFAAAALVVAAIGGYALHGSDGAKHSTVAAVPTAAAPQGTVQASLDRVDGSATLVVNRMPRLTRNRVYEVWAQHGSKMTPESTFVLRRDGSANAAVPGPLDGASAVLVTEEPSGGSDAPTGPPLLSAALD